MNCLSILTTLRSIKTALKMPVKTPVFLIKRFKNQIPKRLKFVGSNKGVSQVLEKWDKNYYYLLLATLKTTIRIFELFYMNSWSLFACAIHSARLS